MDPNKIFRIGLWILIGLYIISPVDIIPMNPIDDVIVTIVGYILNNQLKIKQ